MFVCLQLPTNSARMVGNATSTRLAAYFQTNLTVAARTLARSAAMTWCTAAPKAQRVTRNILGVFTAMEPHRRYLS